MSKFVILLGGHLEKTERLTRQLQGARFIAADSGMRHAAMLSVVPELWVGDFDSAGSGLQDRYSDVERREFPVAKDLTDGEIALEAALEMGATDIVIAGAFGGDRADHGFKIMAMAVARGGEFDSLVLTSGNEEAVPLRTGVRHDINLPSGTLFSILAFSDVEGLTLEGAKWPLHNRNMAFGSSLTLSNEVSGELSVTVGKGRCLFYALLA